MSRAAVAVALILFPLWALAYEPGEELDDPALEARAREISSELRCMVCQNQSIDQSSAPLARDLRLLVRDRLKAGDTNEEVLDFVVDRYGEFVLLRPRMAPHTWLLWFGPLLMLAGGAVLVAVYFRRRSKETDEAPAALDQHERERLARLLEEDSG